jgi:glycosyltransferase involved in cell wall biosynthesis
VLIIVQNLPVPLDRRVWLECCALVEAGYGVSVICPKGPGEPSFQLIDGVHIHKYAPPRPAAGVLGYLVEFVYCWVRTALLSVRVLRREGFDIVQACNPPDTYFLLARLYRLLGKRFVYDQHDLNPEVFLARFGEPRTFSAKAQLSFLRRLEAWTYRTAHHVVVTNESYRRVAIERGGVPKDRVTVVRSAPDTSRMRPVPPHEPLRGGARYLVAYLGIMGPQDGVDLLLRAWAHLTGALGRDDAHLALLGFGDCLDDLRRLADDLGISDRVTFTGRVGPEAIAAYLSTADLGVCPDPSNPLNDVSTMNKVLEYMAYAVPVVAFDLPETRVSAGDAAVYVPSPDPTALARAVDGLLADDEARMRLAVQARRRVRTLHDWQAQQERYVTVYEALLGVPAQRSAAWPEVERRESDREPDHGSTPLVDEQGNELVDLRGPAALMRFVRQRTGEVDAVTTAPAGEPDVPQEGRA